MFIKNIGSIFLLSLRIHFLNSAYFVQTQYKKIKDLIHMDKVFWCR